ncbi:cell wall-binding repeat-containing protein [Agrococcus sp. Ld7]|uniref:cell wall-binding repeat-containing protein n=1 Tax=Agrococcus sp. Ld7 TaxID=649148 RepID=UPI00386A6F73
MLVGSSASISERVAALAAQAARAGGGTAPTLTRIGGTDRVETSLLLFERLLQHGPIEQVWVASGSKFPDALVAASVAGRHGHAVILDHHGPTETSARAWIERVSASVAGRRVTIAGGEPSVSAFDAQALRGAGTISVERYAGANRYETARVINAAWAAESLEPTMLLATGQNFPDALAGAVLAAVVGVPLFLSPSACNDDVSAMLWNEADRRGIDTVVGLGSAAAIRSSALDLEHCPMSLPQELGARYGTFAAQSFAGTGNRVVDLGTSVPFARIRATFASSGLNEIVGIDIYQRDNAYPVHTRGNAYRGESLMVARELVGVRYLEIRTTGAWTVDVRDLTGAPIMTSSTRGQWDAVYLYDGPPRSLTLASTRGTEFSAIAYDDTGAHGLVSRQSGPFTTTAALGEGPSIVSVTASSPWTLALR